MADLIRPQRCETCKHFNKGPQFPECRRYPPHLTIFRDVGKLPSGKTHIQFMPHFLFAVTDPNLWCGEWAVRLEGLNS